MPNWCRTNYTVTGPKKNCKALYDTMKKLQEMPAPGLHENDFGSAWLGNLVIKIGGDWKKISCRGSFDDLELHEDGHVTFSTETAWNECSELRHMLEEKFAVKVFFMSEECGLEIYETNDARHTWFPERYFLWIEGEVQDYYRG